MFSTVILEKQPTPSKSWIWDSLKPPLLGPGGPTGVRSYLSTKLCLVNKFDCNKEGK